MNENAPQNWVSPGCALGIVEDAGDPERRGRLRIRIPQLHGVPSSSGQHIATRDLPWALPCFGFASGGSGLLAVPNVGSGVVCLFVGGKPEEVVWVGSWLAQGESPQEFSSGYTDSATSYILKTPSGMTVELRDHPTNPMVRLSTKAGSYIEMNDTTQTLNMYARNGVTIQTEGTFSVNAANFVVTATNSVSISSAVASTYASMGNLTLSAAALVGTDATGRPPGTLI